MKLNEIFRGDIKKSPYQFRIRLNDTEPMNIIELWFSSSANRNRFYENYLTEIENTNRRIMNVYKNMFSLNLTLFAIIRYYTQVERRGFYIKFNGDEYTCLNEITFQLENLTKSKN